MQLSILIVSYNAKYFPEHCLLSVNKACKGLDAEILVWDNNSSDGSREYLEPKFNNVRFFWAEENLGFGKANNQLLQYAKGDFILFLNPDTIVPEDCFSICIDFLRANTNTGALGVRMIDGSGQFLPESKRGFPDAAASLFKITGLAKLFPRSETFAAYYAGHLPEKKTGQIEVLAGAFLMLTKAALEKTKGFDEKFFMYGEDIDLSYRVKEAGFSTVYFPAVTIIHFKGESTQKKSAGYQHHFYGAMKIFADKHYKGIGNFFIRAGINISSGINRLKNTFSKKENNNALPVKMILVLPSAADATHAKQICEANNISTEMITVSELSNTNIGEHICFCQGELSNKDLIDLTDSIGAGRNIYFHQQGAESIIGSSNKNKNGTFITTRG